MDALPAGTFYGTFRGQRYVVSKSIFNAGRSLKLAANALDGRDYISLNYYQLASGPRLFPCEMSPEKVARFVLELIPDQDAE